jgi:hypothetical protein
MKKKAGKSIYPPFAGIILIRYAGIFSAIASIDGSTPVNNCFKKAKIRNRKFFLKNCNFSA